VCPSQRHWVIGDVHGCAGTLARLVDQLPQRDHLVLLGDVINRGPRIEAAMELSWDLVRGGRATWLMGNHEQNLLRDLTPGTAPEEEIRRRRLDRCDTYRQLGDRRCRIWQERLRNLPLLFRGGHWVATHAGFDPRTWQPDLTIRLPFWETYDGRFGEVVVGHTPGRDLRRIGRIVLIDTGACYGGHLTAYCPENGEVCRVDGPAAAEPLSHLRVTPGAAPLPC
jgi:serine/threonine protein phosphatase 1